LLQLDRPVPARSEAEIAAEVARHYRWNFVVNLLDGVFFWFGLSFASSTTILPLFISKLTTSTLPIGLVAVIAQSGWFLPQLLTANAVERLARKKPVIVNLGFFTERLPLLLFVPAALVAGRSPLLAIALLLGGYAGHAVGAGVVATAWQDLIARCFPVDRRGRFFGLTAFLGAGTGALGAVFSAWLLQTFPFPTNFVYIFTIATAGMTLSWFFLALTREPVQAVSVPRQSNRQFLSGLPDLLRRDHNFRRFLLTRMLMALGGMGMGFVTVAAVHRWQVPDSTVGVYTAVLLIGQTFGNLAFGLLADRFGHKLCLEIGALAALLGFGLAWLAPAAEWYYAAFALLGIGAAAVFVSGILVVLEFCAPERRPTYVGIANTGVGLVGVVSPLVGAWLASVDYGWLFALSAGISLAALILMRWWVREPRHA
jgi:MFS family permease